MNQEINARTLKKITKKEKVWFFICIVLFFALLFSPQKYTKVFGIALVVTIGMPGLYANYRKWKKPNDPVQLIP